MLLNYLFFVMTRLDAGNMRGEIIKPGNDSLEWFKFSTKCPLRFSKNVLILYKDLNMKHKHQNRHTKHETLVMFRNQMKHYISF